MRHIDNLSRIQQIVDQAANLPRIDPPAEGWNPTPEELLKGYARLAFSYATSTALLQQAIPILIEEIRAVHNEIGIRARGRALRKAAR